MSNQDETCWRVDENGELHRDVPVETGLRVWGRWDEEGVGMTTFGPFIVKGLSGGTVDLQRENGSATMLADADILYSSEAAIAAAVEREQ